MHFELTQKFSAPPETVLDAYLDEAMWATLDGFTRVGEPRWIGIERQGNTATTRVHYRFIASLPAAAKAIVNPEKLAWVQVTKWDCETQTCSIGFEPDAYADKLSIKATESLRADGTGGTIRKVEGELKVRVMLVGSRVEPVIVDGLLEYLREEAERVQTWIDAR